MRVLVASLMVAVSSAVAYAAPAAPGEKPAAEEKEKFGVTHVDELAKLLASGKVQVFDVNGDDFRATNGVIPGAIMLPGIKFDPAKFLPTDKTAQLVFYCANSH